MKPKTLENVLELYSDLLIKKGFLYHSVISQPKPTLERIAPRKWCEMNLNPFDYMVFKTSLGHTEYQIYGFVDEAVAVEFKLTWE